MRLHFPDAPHRDHTFLKQASVLLSDDGWQVANDAEVEAGRDSGQVCIRLDRAHARDDRNHTDDALVCLHVADRVRCHVNARPVKRMAWLHAGDVLVVEPPQGDAITLHLQSEQPPAAPPHDTQRLKPSDQIHDVRVVLRGVRGHDYGSCVPLQQTFELCGGDEEQSNTSVRIGMTEAGVVARAADGDSIWVNGHPVHEALLHAGDQLQCGDTRYVLEAPGHRSGQAEAITRSQPAVSMATDVLGAQQVEALRRIHDETPTQRQPAVPAQPSSEHDFTHLWLIGCAVLIGIILFFLFF